MVNTWILVKGYDEFWNDNYLMWELFYDDIYGYSNDNINVLFGEGIDYSITFPLYDGRYNPYDKSPGFPLSPMAQLQKQM